MANHLEEGSHQPKGRGGGGGQQHIAHVSNRAVGHHALHVALGNRRQGSVEHRDRCPAGQPGSSHLPGIGEQAKAEAKQAIGAQLEQHAGQKNRHWCGSLGVGIRQPGVEREEGNLDAEADQQSAHKHQLGGHAQFTSQDRPQAEVHGSSDKRNSEERAENQNA